MQEKRPYAIARRAAFFENRIGPSLIHSDAGRRGMAKASRRSGYNHVVSALWRWQRARAACNDYQ